jgi:general stress protein 26
MDEKKPGSLDELYRLLQDFDTVMLVTLTPDHQLRARPMALQDRSLVADCDLWFVTAADTAKVEEINEEHRVNVCCLRSRDKAYLSISATARISDDANEIRRLYQPDWRVWMGDDHTASAVLLKLTIERAEYWAPEGGRVRVLYEMLKAAVSGEAASDKLPPPREI